MRALLRVALAKYERTGDVWWHLDGHALDRALGSRDTVELIVRLHEAASTLAKDAMFHLWRDPVEAGHEELVAAALGDMGRYYPDLAWVDLFEKMKLRGALPVRSVFTMRRSQVESGHQAVVGTTMRDLEQYYYRSTITLVDSHRKMEQ